MDVPRGKLSNLTELNLSYCSELDDAGLSSLLNLCSDKLTTLNVADTDVSGVYLDVPSGKLSNLTELILKEISHLTDAGLSSLLNLCSDKLTTLNVPGTSVSGTY